jgi:pimeloyl-ACP methyl ester carboxylesterase
MLLLHGFPYDVRQYDGISKRREVDGLHLIVPCCRGLGLTNYRSYGVFRSGQQAALRQDVIDLLDALDIERAILVGYSPFDD